MIVGITNDHFAVSKKNKIKAYLEKKGHTVIDYGYNGDENVKVDYPKYAFELAKNMDKLDIGILICTSGIGMSIAANRIKGVRCARITNVKDAKETRIHNNANVIALNESMFLFEAKDIIDTFLKTKYVPDERFERRINKMLDYEDK